MTPVRLSKLSLIVAVGATVALGACGGGSSNAKASGTTTTTARGAARQAYRNCLQQHGVNLPQRPPGTRPPGGNQNGQNDQGGGGGFGGGFGNQPPPGVDAKTFQAAQQACASVRPAGGFGNGGNAANRQAFQAYFSCLKDHGVNVPTTTQGGGGLGGIDRNSPAFQAANQVCAPLMPARPGSTTTTTS
jgi:hypothetical protein